MSVCNAAFSQLNKKTEKKRVPCMLALSGTSLPSTNTCFFSPPPRFPNPVETPEEETTTATVSLLGSSVLFVGYRLPPIYRRSPS